MLSHHLQCAYQDLQDLISITQSDIEDIKMASHDAQFNRVSMKEDKLKSFETKKAMIDYEIAKLMSENPTQDLTILLTQEQSQELSNMKEALSELRETNNAYAKMVLTITGFYNTLLERVMPTEMDGYATRASSNSSFLQVKA